MNKSCSYCNRDFEVPKKEVNRDNGKYCSRSCAAKAGNIIKRKNFYSRLKNIKYSPLDIKPEIGNYISGLTDGEGCFLITLVNKSSLRIRASFKIDLTIEDRKILEWSKDVLNTGNTYFLPQRSLTSKAAFRFSIQDFESIITKIIPLFEQFPLQGKKSQDFLRFKSVINEYIDEMLLDNPNISGILDTVKKINREYVSDIDEPTKLLNGDYISGLTDGEGTFAIKVTKDKEMKCGYRIKPTFSIQLSDKDIELLKRVRNTLNCGTVRLDYNRNIADFSVQSIRDIEKYIIPFFNKYKLRAKKRKDFLHFKHVIECFARKEHLTIEGINKIINIRELMNSGGAPNRLKL